MATFAARAGPLGRSSVAPSVTSTYSDDWEQQMAFHPSVRVAPLNSKPSYHPSYHAHPQQNITDTGPLLHTRQSRLPLFSQVRSMLQKQPAALVTPQSQRPDEVSDVSPYQGVFQAERRRSSTRLAKKSREVSPVSVLRDDELAAFPHQQSGRDSPDNRSPVSPVSRHSSVQRELPRDTEPFGSPQPFLANIPRTALAYEQSPASSHRIKRKPVSRCISLAENYPPQSPQHSRSSSGETYTTIAEEQQQQVDSNQPNSHFSWVTGAPSVASPRRQSMDTATTSQSPKLYLNYQDNPKKSHFSWTTVGTSMTQQQQARFASASPPSSPPRIPRKYSTPPVQSILSRQRPIKRLEAADDWKPPPRIRIRTDSPSATAPTTTNNTPISAPATSTPTSTTTKTTLKSPSRKALPAPPPLTTTPQTHLETLQTHERNLHLQRRNVEKAMAEFTKVETASPLTVPFASVRVAQKRLRDYRERLAEVKLEERDVGVAIARARRREEKEGFGVAGLGEGLWVRRVTG